jgi:cytochrome c553
MTQGVRVFLLLLAIGVVGGAMFFAAGEIARERPSKAGAVADDLRPLLANVADVAEGRRVADGTCSRCHGENGISTTKGVPHLAGQRPSYLYTKLREYQLGRLGGHAMEGAVKFLSEDALVKVSAYYASLDPAQPAPGVSNVAVTDIDPLAAGRALAAGCEGCHGATGVTSIPGMPNLVGFDPKYFVASMEAYKSGQRKHDVMQALAAKLGEEDLKALALFYAVQTPERARTPADGDPAAGKVAAAACAGCHGEQGVSTNPANPSLAGQDAQYFVAAMKAYQDGSRKDETMKLAVSALSERAIVDMGAFYASQQPQAPKVQMPLTLAQWVQRCDLCHGVNGNSSDPRTPAIAGQRIEYLRSALHAYRKGERKGSVMDAMARSLTDDDVERLSAYYARQNARAFVFVIPPAQ